MAMSIKKCHLEGNYDDTQIDIITNGTVRPELANMIQLVDTTTNRLAEFTWRVFATGISTRMTITCQVKIVKDIQDTTTTTPTTTTTSTTTTTTTSVVHTFNNLLFKQKEVEFEENRVIMNTLVVLSLIEINFKKK